MTIITLFSPKVYRPLLLATVLQLLLLPTRSLAQDFLIAYQTEAGWYVFNSAGDSLLHPGQLGLTGPVAGPVHGLLRVRQLHELDAKTLTPTLHDILMDAKGKRYLETLPPQARILAIIGRAYAITQHSQDGTLAIYDIATGKQTGAYAHNELGPYAHKLVWMHTFDATSETPTVSPPWVGVDPRTGKVMAQITAKGVSYLSSREPDLLVAYMDNGEEYLVDAKGKLQGPPPPTTDDDLPGEPDADAHPTEPYETSGPVGNITVMDPQGKVLLKGLAADEVLYVCRGYVGYRKGDFAGLRRLADGRDVVAPTAGYARIQLLRHTLACYYPRTTGPLRYDARTLDGRLLALPHLPEAFFIMPFGSPTCAPATPAIPAGLSYFISY